MAKGNGGIRGFLSGRWTTNFVDRDPEIDVYKTMYRDQHIKEDDLAALAGLSTSTVKNMFGGKTRRPQHLTYSKLAAAMGKEYVLQDMREVDYASEIPQAKLQRKEYRAILAKKAAKLAKRTRKTS